MFRSKVYAGVMALSALSAASANAAIQTFTDRSAFDVAAGSTLQEDFNSLAVGDIGEGVVDSRFNGFSISYVQGAGSTDFSAGVATSDQFGTGGIDGSNLFVWDEDLFREGDGDIGPTITIVFDQPTFAFGFDWRDRDVTDAYTLSVAGVEFTDPPFPTGFGEGFFGIVSDVAFSGVVLRSTDQGGNLSQLGIDNVAVGQPTIIPAPAAAPLLLLGIGGLGLVKRKRRAA